MRKLLMLIAPATMLLSCEGTEFAPAHKFYGTYSVSESCNSGSSTYSIQISEASNSDGQVIIRNFGDFGGQDIVATATNDKIEFLFKTGTLLIVGSGVINESQNSIQFVYQTSAVDNTETDNCSAVAIKK